MENLEIDFIKTTSNALKTFKKKEDEILLPFSLSSFHAKYIKLLHKFKEMTMNKLTELIGVDKANTTRAVKELLDQQIVEKQGGIRKFKLILTKKGVEIAEKFMFAFDNFFKRVLKDFTDAEKTTLVNLLNKLHFGLERELRG
ncbi:MAG: MarR family transcriptional regulator [Clostridia bacterium]|nr:MarR family transcriptional regulator [Clostridia bacterium]